MIKVLIRPKVKNLGLFVRGFSLLSACNARNTKPPAIELPSISRVQEIGGNSYAGDYDSAAC